MNPSHVTHPSHLIPSNKQRDTQNPPPHLAFFRTLASGRFCFGLWSPQSKSLLESGSTFEDGCGSSLHYFSVSKYILLKVRELYV